MRGANASLRSTAQTIKMASYRLRVPAPTIRDRQFSKPLLCGPGPNDIYPAVAAAFDAPVMTPACEEYYKVIEDIRTGIQYAFQTRSKLVLAVSGSGHAGMETVISNLMAPGELLLVPSRGIWDERAKDMARRYGIRVESITTSEPFTTFSFEELESALERHRPAGLFITHGDSSTGTLQALKGLGHLCHKYGTLLLVDTVASLGAEPLLMDEWGIDGTYASCQKALSGPAGVSPVAFSSRAETKIFSRSTNPPFYFDIKLLARQWRCYDNNFFYHHTLSSPLLWALRACLFLLAQESLPRVWARHAAVAAHFHARLRTCGFRFLVRKPEDRMTAVTTIKLGMDCNVFVEQFRSKHNIMITPGLGPTAGAAVRVGLMGVTARPDVADRVADAIADVATSIKL
ncbi:serine--pyruvate aminotransferase-like isoform X2 [Leguminivora glycinivorella]|uniref:serine--pyruvate aminotransferase-like isoform X2 n=1 Tax=Leguminivora glycinivorella TaxID=1035111 RepID=UPI00200D5B26|nr:serine--pyruvate aminotransferase-like isoform X2 [Leguminivora glycinivorella]